MKVLSLRLDDAVYEELKKKAAEDDRSINKAIVYAIKQYIKGKQICSAAFVRYSQVYKLDAVLNLSRVQDHSRLCNIVKNQA